MGFAATIVRGMRCVPVAAILVAMAGWALAQSSSGLDMPEQIGTPDSSVVIEEIVTVPQSGAAQIRIDPIGGTGQDRSVTIDQTIGGHDLCDPSVPAWQARQAGIDCAALAAREVDVPEDGGHVSPPALDPLLTPDNSDTTDTFDALKLGTDVPATVILQQ